MGGYVLEAPPGGNVGERALLYVIDVGIRGGALSPEAVLLSSSLPWLPLSTFESLLSGGVTVGLGAASSPSTSSFEASETSDASAAIAADARAPNGSINTAEGGGSSTGAIS